MVFIVLDCLLGMIGKVFLKRRCNNSKVANITTMHNALGSSLKTMSSAPTRSTRVVCTYMYTAFLETLFNFLSMNS